MTKQEQVVLKAERGEGLTVEEIKIYQEAVKPVQHVYGKYGTLKRKYLEEKGIDWTIADLPTYLHGIDKQADELGNFMEDYRRQTEIQRLIEEEILNEIVYVA